ncbi:MAG: cache domain-containing protein, partial [Burkholderiales bacterium]
AALIGIAIHNYWAMRTDALALSEGVIANLRERIETEVEAYLRPINGIIRLSRDLLEDELAAGIPDAEVEALGISMLTQAPQLTALFVGSRDGEFVMVRREQRDGQEVLETKRIRRSERAPDGFEIAYTRRDDQGRVVSRENAPWDQYDPRTRPWYQGADRERQLHWTEVYPFFTARAPGITVSVPVLAADGALRAAIGADVTLQSISRFLASLSIGKSGQAMIIDAKGQLIAHPRADLIRDEGNDKLRLSRIDDLDDPVVRRAYDYYRVERVGQRAFELNGRRYISSVSSLDRLLKRDWAVLLVVPEDDFVGFVGDNVRKMLVMGLSTMALAGLLAWLLIRQGLRTDREATRVLERKAELEATAKAFGQLASAGSVALDPGDSQALRPFTESASEAARVRRVSIWHLAPASGGLTCLDCYDRDTGGHTHGTRLARQDYPELFAALEAEPFVAAVDAGADVRLASLNRLYLQPLGCRALLAVPVKAAERLKGAVLLEDTGQRVEWPAHTAAFARALANLLAVGAAGAGATAPETAPSSSAAPAAGARARPHPELSAAFRDRDIDTTLGERRAAAFAARLSHAADGVSGVEVVEQLAVLSLQLTNSAVLAKPTDQDGAESTVAQLLEELQAAARDEGVDYLKFFSDQVIASVDPNEDVGEALQHLAEVAHRVKAVCESLFARHQAALAFRIGIDVGPAVGSLVGRDNPAFAFWGEAVRTAMSMADSSFPGAIQVTESVYQVLRSRYVFQMRGRHYLEGLGEFSTYVLGGRL